MLLPLFIAQIESESDRAFMERLYRKYRRLMYAQVYELCSGDGITGDMADDAVSDSCVTLLRKTELIKRLDERALRAYIIAVVRSRTIDLLRRRGRPLRSISSDSDDDSLDAVAADAPDASERIIARETVSELAQAITLLSERDRELLNMKYMLEMSDAEIAQALGMGADSVRPALMRARRRAYARFGEVTRHEPQ